MRFLPLPKGQFIGEQKGNPSLIFKVRKMFTLFSSKEKENYFCPIDPTEKIWQSSGISDFLCCWTPKFNQNFDRARIRALNAPFPFRRGQFAFVKEIEQGIIIEIFASVSSKIWSQFGSQNSNLDPICKFCSSWK